MKRLLFLFFTTSSLLFIEIGCSKEGVLPLTSPDTETHTEANIQSDSVLIEINPIFNISSEPMSTRASNNDLYAVEVSKQNYFTNELGNDWIGTTIYACGYFDDLSKAVIKLAKRDKYGVTVAYIPNGKELIYQYPDGHYGAPCDTGLNSAINQVVYASGLNIYSNCQTSSHKDNLWNSIERYQGVTINFDPKTNTSVSVKLYKMVFGFKFEISDFHSGVVTIAGVPNMSGHTYNIYPDENGNGFLDIAIESPAIPTAGDINHYTQLYPDDPYGENYEQVDNYVQSLFDGGSTQLHIQYTTDKGEVINLYNNINFEYTRNTKYKLSFSLEDAIKNGGITTDINENE